MVKISKKFLRENRIIKTGYSKLIPFNPPNFQFFSLRYTFENLLKERFRGKGGVCHYQEEEVKSTGRDNRGRKQAT